MEPTRCLFSSLVFLVGSTLLPGASAHAQTVCFEAPVSFPVGTPSSVAAADLDRDGDVDLLVVVGSNLHVYRNQGDGTFAPGGLFYAGPSPLGPVVLGDLDGDGAPEAALPVFTANRVSVLRNNGNGSFALPVEYTVQVQPLNVAIGDLDNSGFADLVVTNSQSNTFTLLLNNGDGTFASGGPNYFTGSYPVGVAIDDVNGDGKRDVIVANRAAVTLSVFRGNGNGTFAAPVTLPCGLEPSRVYTRDVNGDGRLDVLVSTPPGFSVFLQQPGGTLAAAVPYALGCDSAGFDLADLDGDGDLDVVGPTRCPNSLVIALGNGNGTFAAPSSNFATALDPTFVATGDFDGDGDADVVVTEYLHQSTTSRFEVFRNCRWAGVPYCAGDGVAPHTACPCGNHSPAVDRVGCLHSFGVGGRLRATGGASLSADALVLNAENLPAASVLFFQGTTQENGGNGSLFGDGLRCAGGTVIRLGTFVATGTPGSATSHYPQAGDPAVSVRGSVLAPGLRTYQAWFRNTASFCTPAGYNLTNGIVLRWAP